MRRFGDCLRPRRIWVSVVNDMADAQTVPLTVTHTRRWCSYPDNAVSVEGAEARTPIDLEANEMLTSWQGPDGAVLNDCFAPKPHKSYQLRP